MIVVASTIAGDSNEVLVACVICRIEAECVIMTHKQAMAPLDVVNPIGKCEADVIEPLEEVLQLVSDVRVHFTARGATIGEDSF